MSERPDHVLSPRLIKTDGKVPIFDMTVEDLQRIADEVRIMNEYSIFFLEFPKRDLILYWRAMLTLYDDVKVIMNIGNIDPSAISEVTNKPMRIGGQKFFDALKTQLDKLIDMYYSDTRNQYPTRELIDKLDLFRSELLKEKKACGIGIRTKKKRGELGDGIDIDKWVNIG